MLDHASSPLVTIGMPVYNEAVFLAESLDNILGQTQVSLEILIGDNGSTDATQEICAAYAARHPNLTHIRHPRNIGADTNFNELARAAAGTYFLWAAGHDLLDPDFVEKSVAALESDPAAVLAFPRTVNMKSGGEPTGEKTRPFDIRSFGPARRFTETMWRVDCNYVYGVWRRKPLVESMLFRRFPAADRVLLAEMAIRGTFTPVDTFRYCRMNRGETPQTEMEKRHRLMALIHPDRAFTDAELRGNRFYAPTVRGFRRVVEEAGFSWPTRRRLFFSVWLCGAMKSHLFPGADLFSRVAKAVLPDGAQRKILSWMR